ncbi:MAG: tetratricopeptide repeat protein [Bacteroidales bacterium]|nr:tetratricopeptide repeat protein [Bacteroidales bacterium]
MKKGSWIIVLTIFTVIVIISCSRRLLPTDVTGIKGESYDSAAFDYLYVEGIKQKILGNAGDALRYFEQCLKINPESGAAYYQMAQIVMTLGDISNGKKYLLTALSKEPVNIWYIMMLAGVYYQEKNIDSTIIFYEKAVKYYPERETLHLALANLYSEDRQYEKAVKIYDALDKKYGPNESSTLSAVRSLILAGKHEEALEKIQMLLKERPDEILYNGLLAEIYREKGDRENAREVYNKLIDRNPDNPEILLSLCDFLISEKSYDELFPLLNKIIMNGNITREEKIRLFAQLTEESELIKSMDNELQEIFMVLETKFAEDDIITLLRPELLIKMGKTKEAGTRLEEIIGKRPENYYAWEKLLFLYLQEKDYRNLQLKGEECAKRFNMSFVAKMLYANGAMENGDYDTALEEIRKAGIIAGDNKEMSVQALSMKASVYYKMKNLAKAFETFEEALKADNNDLTILNNYAYYLAEENLRLKEAQEMSAKVIEIEKTNSTYLDTYAWILYKRGKAKEAAKVMEFIMKNEEVNDAELFEHYGYILKKRRSCTKAVENWKKAYEIDNTKTILLKEIENCQK